MQADALLAGELDTAPVSLPSLPVKFICAAAESSINCGHPDRRQALSAVNSPARFLFVDKAAVRNIPDP
jgi:hypothetical protein